MGRRDLARRRPGGGEGIQTLRRARARLSRALVAGLPLAAASAYATAAADRAPALVAAIGAVGVAVTVAGTAFRLASAVPAGIALAGAAYALHLVLGDGALDGGAPLVAGALVLGGELAYSALDPPLAKPPARLRLRRLARAAAAALGAVAVAAFVLLASATGSDATPTVEAVGIAAAVGAVGLLALLATRSA